jgi:hypothetical protein
VGTNHHFDRGVPRQHAETHSLIAVRVLIATWLCLLTTGCTRTITTKDYDELCRKTVNMQNTITGQVYYQGSKKGYDYFLFAPFGLRSHQECVKTGEVRLANRFTYTRDRTKWTIAYPNWNLSTTNGLRLEPTTGAGTLGEAGALAIARQAVATNDTWIDRAQFEAPKRQPDGSWTVMVWRRPTQSGGHRLIRIDAQGKVISYDRGL